MAKKIDFCPICDEYIDINVKGFGSEPFITGRTYESMCYTCACVPKSSFIIFKGTENIKDPINSLDEMLADGFDKKRAETSIKSVKKLLKKKK